jgi:hypothetical protein
LVCGETDGEETREEVEDELQKVMADPEKNGS